MQAVDARQRRGHQQMTAETTKPARAGRYREPPCPRENIPDDNSERNKRPLGVTPYMCRMAWRMARA
jgi:hypothetical protein